MNLSLTAVVVAGLTLTSLSSENDTGAAKAHVETKKIPFDQLGAEVQKRYSGTHISSSARDSCAVLRVAFQRLEAQATPGGLWLGSTNFSDIPDRFRVLSQSFGRESGGMTSLPDTGRVVVESQMVSFVRPGLVEEYRVSMDGVRQDFVILEKPLGTSELSVMLEVTGAALSSNGKGAAQLTLNGSQREIAYSRLQVTDATGKNLQAQMEVTGKSRMRIRVNDVGATYPVRIDPTFSDVNWSNMGGFAGTNGDVYSTAVDAAGNLYIGGSFTAVGDVAAIGVAKWDGSTWSALGAGLAISDGPVYALKFKGSELYLGGGKYKSGNVRKWNGSAWSMLGSGFNDIVLALEFLDDTLYAGGGFTASGGLNVGQIAMWNGSAWSALGTGVNGTVCALAASDGNLLAGGTFTTAGGAMANRIARWDGSAWSTFGQGLDGAVSAIAISGTAVYAGGAFSTAGGIGASRVAKWEGGRWSPLGSGVNGSVYDLRVSGDVLYAGGSFTSAAGTDAAGIARWSEGTWSSVGAGLGPDVRSISLYGSDVYAGGTFTAVAGQRPQGIAKWNGSLWSHFNPPVIGLDGSVHAAVMSGSDLYVGGLFVTAGGASANHIAKWDGHAWTALGSGLNGAVLALAVSGTDLYAAGEFTSAGGVSANHVAKWDGSTWSALGTTAGNGTDGTVYALAIEGTKVYAGGSFTHANAGGSEGVEANNVARWDGSSWSALSSGTDNKVAALAVSNGIIYAGGTFSAAGGKESPLIARWNGTTWDSLGLMGDRPYGAGIYALAVSGTDIYAGGEIDYLGVGAPGNIVKWDSSSGTWTTLHKGLGGPVYSMVVAGADLYVGGRFNEAFNEVWTSKIAKWDGNAWSRLGSGVSIYQSFSHGGQVFALAASGNDLYAGGYFAIVGGRAAAYVTSARLQLYAPQINIRGKGITIANGDSSPSAEEDTDFGVAGLDSGSTERTFAVHNLGDKELSLAGTPTVSISGEEAKYFRVTSQPPSTIEPGGSATLTVAFDPSADTSNSGLKTAVVTVFSDDPATAGYSFTICGFARVPGTVSLSSPAYYSAPGVNRTTIRVWRKNGQVAFDVTLRTADGAVSNAPPFAAAVAGTDYVALTGPATTVHFNTNESYKDVVIELTPTNASTSQRNKRFFVTLSSPTNGAMLGEVTNAAVIMATPDLKKPTIRVIAPASRVSQLSTIMVSGVVSDAKGTREVRLSLNGGNSITADLGPASAASIPFSLAISPKEGENILLVTAADPSGNYATLTHKFTFTRRHSLTLRRSDPAAGTVALAATPAASASALAPVVATANPKASSIVPGALVKLTATARTGGVFRQWLGLPATAVALGNVVTFSMPAESVNVTADFVATPFAPPSGLPNTFFGLIHPTWDTVSTNATHGFLTGTLTSAGAFSGKILIDGAAQPLIATFLGDGSAIFTAGSRKVSTLTFGGRTLALEFDTGAIRAKITSAAGTSQGTATRPIYSISKGAPSLLFDSAGRGLHTVSFLSKAQTPEIEVGAYPQGHGFATLNLTRSGGVIVAGTLADGTTVTGSSALLAGHLTPLLIQLPTPGAPAKKGGSLSGALAFDNTQADSDVTGSDLLWFRAAAEGASAATHLYTLGWPNSIRVDAVGALYDGTKKVQSTLGLPASDPTNGNGLLLFTDGKLTSDIPRRNFNINGDTVTKTLPIDATYTLILAPSLGRFSGTFVPNWANPAAARPAFRGILLQKGASRGGYGFFISNAKNDPDLESGSVTLPAP